MSSALNPEMNEEKRNAVEEIWNYMLLGHEMKKADVIICLGSHDLRVASKYLALLLVLSSMLSNILNQATVFQNYPFKISDKIIEKAVSLYGTHT